jgi:type VII secretion protein EccB
LGELKVAFRLSILVAVVILAAGLGMALLRPAPGPGVARLVMLRDSGALFVRVDDRWHPVANLASARLILGSPERPRLVDERELGRQRGAPLGLPGAPHKIGPTMAGSAGRWTVCDDAAGATTLAIGAGGGTVLDADQSLLVESADERGGMYLIYGGKRARIDADNPVVARTLGISGIPARRISAVLLNQLPEVSEIAVPRIPTVGQRSRVIDYPVGSVLQLNRAGSVDYYAVLRDGLQRVGPVAADLVRYADSGADAEIAVVSPDELAATPLVDELAVATYPVRVPSLSELRGELCVAWSPSGASEVLVDPMIESRLRLAQADDAGLALDYVALPSGVSIYASAQGAQYLITDTGARFAVHDPETATALGLSGTPVDVPWPLLAVLPAGPELSRTAASIERDTFGS